MIAQVLQAQKPFLSSSLCRNAARVFQQRTASSAALAVKPATTEKPQPESKLNILFLCNSDNSLSQRVGAELKQRGHTVTVCANPSASDMVAAARNVQPDLILCPFLTKRVPEELYKGTNVPCLIVHPGITGDRGASSIDWALKESTSEWGVTVMQADDEMDAGDIYATSNFKITRNATKSSLYMSEITQSAVKVTVEAIDNFVNDNPPQPLDYNNPTVKGSLRRNMTKKDRLVDWSKSAEEIARTIRMSDTQPGATLRTLDGASYLAFGAHVEQNESIVQHLGQGTEPGDILAHRDGAVLFKSVDGKGVWVSHMKSKPGKASLKLPATSVVSANLLRHARKAPVPPLMRQFGQQRDTFQEIWTTQQDDVVYVHFDFYNGAMSTEQCNRLTNVMKKIAEDKSSKVVVLMGGHNYFSNGIHLNVIENSQFPAAESWANINAINDFIKTVFSMKDKVTVAAVQGNAGAGGAMAPLAADLVWTHSGVVLNPHYKSMHLFGSEYWTYFLPLRVGEEKAYEITNNIKPMLAKEAVEIGMYDKLIGENRAEFSEQIQEESKKLASSSLAKSILEGKSEKMWSYWLEEVERHRYHELGIMKDNFVDPAYHNARSDFVYH